MRALASRMGTALVVAVACLPLTACTGDNPELTTVSVDVRVTACVQDGARCFDLGVPGADVELLDAGNRPIATGRTDEHGLVTLSVLYAGPATARVRSPLMKDGGKAVSIGVAVAGSHVDTNVWSEMSNDVMN